MFRPSGPNQISLFSSVDNQLSDKSLKIYQDKNSWHNLFRKNVTMKIDESVFAPLYSSTNGAPNSPVCTMVAMMVIKESQGMSDEQLYSDCRFNLLVRSALALFNTDDSVPAESTYYAFRKKVSEYAKEFGINLFDLAFSKLTKGQCLEFGVSGKRARLDSKMLGSNIAWLSRYELVHETLRLFYRKIKKGHILDKDLKNKLDNILAFEGEKVVYRSSDSEIKDKFKELGVLIYRVLSLNIFCNDDIYKTLQRVFEEQFEVTESEEIISRDKEKISAKSVQSPHDTDCHFRNKDGEKVKGYSINVTESCDDDHELNLIGDVDVRVVSEPDVNFFQESVEDAQDVFVDKVEDVHADGAYNSSANQEYCAKKDIDLHLHAIQGYKGRYELSLSAEGTMNIWDSKTCEYVEVDQIKCKNGGIKWRIRTENRYRYFTEKDLKVCQLRNKIEQTPLAILQKRNNVEATIFQLGYHYPNAKSRYRGIEKHQMWANMRCMWINFVRIAKFIKEGGGGAPFPLGDALFLLFSLAKSFFCCLFSCFGILLGFVNLFSEEEKLKNEINSQNLKHGACW